jgi:hypothetical protein
LASARKVDFLGGQQSEQPVDADQVSVEIRPREWIQVEAAFSS